MHKTMLFRCCSFGFALALGAGCNIKSPGDDDSIQDDIDDTVDDVVDDVENTEICDGKTLEELFDAKTVSDECKQTLESYLPQPDDNFSGNIVVLGSETDEADGTLRVFLHGADDTGAALDADAYASATVSVGGTALVEGEFTITALADLPGDWLSLGLVNDYSASMSESDLDVVSIIETDMFTYLPPVYEGAVTLFSVEVVQKQDYTTDSDELLAAVEKDTTFERDLTALYDGMGAGLDGLIARERPGRLLVVSTDGRENSSTLVEKAELVQKVTENGIPVLMLGGLFADIDEMKELMGDWGVFFYTPLYEDARDHVEEYLKSLEQAVAVEIPEDKAQERPIHIQIGDTSVDIE
jgi:hypothetical protein